MAHRPCLLGWFFSFVASPLTTTLPELILEKQDWRRARPIRSRGPERGLVVGLVSGERGVDQCERTCRVGLISNSESRKFRPHNLYICTYFDIYLIVWKKKLGIPRNTQEFSCLRQCLVLSFLKQSPLEYLFLCFVNISAQIRSNLVRFRSKFKLFDWSTQLKFGPNFPNFSKFAEFGGVRIFLAF